MAIILLSESQNNSNIELLNTIKDKLKGIEEIAYIPSASDPGLLNYNNYVKGFFESVGIKEMNYLGLEDGEYKSDTLDQLQKAKAIFLSGGNTFNFLYWLRKRNLLGPLKEFSKTKIFIGVSAGSILLTPNIGISKDGNEILKLTELDSISAVDFYFRPHFTNTIEDIQHIKNFVKNHSKENIKPVYAVNDASGIIVDEGEINLYGDIKIF